MERCIQRKLILLKIDHITPAESSEYNNSPAINHTIWCMRGINCKETYFAEEIENDIQTTARDYQISFNPFAIYYEPILRSIKEGNYYYFCRVHLYCRKEI